MNDSYISIAILSFISGIAVCGAVLLFFVKQKNHSLQTDDITGLPNYKGLIAKFKSLNSKHIPYVIFLIDLNDFRQYNKKGYEYGDKKLIEFAGLLKQSVGNHAFIARFRAGDEFIIISSQENRSLIKSTLEDINSINSTGSPSGLFAYGEAEGIVSHENYRNVIHAAEVKLINEKEKKKNLAKVLQNG